MAPTDHSADCVHRSPGELVADTASVVSSCGFTLDEKDSIRPDDSASVRAPDDELLSTDPDVSLAEHNPGKPCVANGSVLIEDEPDTKILDALQSSRDRMWVLKLEQDVLHFISHSDEGRLELPECNSFYRMLTHRLADYYSLGHSVNPTGNAVILYKTPNRRLPPLLSTLISQEYPTSKPASVVPTRTIMRRTGNAGSTSATTVSSITPSKSVSETGADSSSDTGRSSESKLPSRQEREAKYHEARQRIFGGKEIETLEMRAAELSFHDSNLVDGVPGGDRGYGGYGNRRKYNGHRKQHQDGYDPRYYYGAPYDYYGQPYYDRNDSANYSNGMGSISGGYSEHNGQPYANYPPPGCEWQMGEQQTGNLQAQFGCYHPVDNLAYSTGPVEGPGCPQYSPSYSTWAGPVSPMQGILAGVPFGAPAVPPSQPTASFQPFNQTWTGGPGSDRQSSRGSSGHGRQRSLNSHSRNGGPAYRAGVGSDGSSRPIPTSPSAMSASSQVRSGPSSLVVGSGRPNQGNTSIAKWGVPANLPARPPLPTSMEPAKFLETHRDHRLQCVGGIPIFVGGCTDASLAPGRAEATLPARPDGSSVHSGPGPASASAELAVSASVSRGREDGLSKKPGTAIDPAGSPPGPKFSAGTGKFPALGGKIQFGSLGALDMGSD